MGPTPLSWKELQTELERDPESVTWSAPRDVILCKGKSGKLGLKLKTYQGKEYSYTVIAKVKDDCCKKRGILNVFDRILSINYVTVVKKTGKNVIQIIEHLPASDIVLNVAYPVAAGGRPFILTPRNLQGIKNPSAKQFTFETQTDSGDTCTFSSDSELISDNTRSFQSGEICDKSSLLQGNIGISVHNAASVAASQSTVTLRDYEEVQSGSKRGHSQISGSSSSQSTNSDSSVQEVGMRKSKADNKGRSKLKAGDHAELEPLAPRHGDSVSPGSCAKQERLAQIFQEDICLYSRSPSLPVRDTTVSMQDINFEDHSHSLPIGHMSSCQCPGCTGATDSRVCYSCGAKPSVSSKKPTSPGVSLRLDSKESLTEEYAAFLLKNPHYAVWDGKNTHVVEIDRGSAKEFGFAFKVKRESKPDGSEEVYTLVKSVEKGGPAVGKLQVGDWIRSVNGNPIQNSHEAFSLISRGRGGESRTLRLLIQKPVGFSQHPSVVRTNKSDSYAESSSVPSVHLTPSPNPREQDPLIPGIVEMKNSPEKLIRQQNLYFTDMVGTVGESGRGSLPFPKTVKFPKMRIFICGSEAEKCAELILLNSDIKILNRNSGYSCIEFSMATDCFGNVLLTNVCSDLFAASCQLNTHSLDVCEPGHKSEGDVKCRNCGKDYNLREMQSGAGTLVNVELFVVPDDRLFHCCCTYLFTKSPSMFILTFDGGKMLSSASHEFSRLQNLSHTVRSFAGEERYIMTCGLLESAPEANIMDEVQALFYTPLNTQLLNLNVSGPELINISKSQGEPGSLNQSRELQVLLWRTITDTIQRPHVQQHALLIVDYLHAVHDTNVILMEDQFTAVIKTKLPEYQQDIHQIVLIELNTCGEIILGKATPSFCQSLVSIDKYVILKPRYLLDCLSQAVATLNSDKQTWSRTFCTGFIKAEELIRLMNIQGDSNHQKCVIEFLHRIGLIFSKPKSCVTMETEYFHTMETEYFLPYFAQVPSSCDIPLAGKKDLELYLQFTDHESYQTFYQVVFMLVNKCDNVDSLAVHAANCTTFTHQRMLITAYFQKTDDVVKLIFRREDKSGTCKPSELYDWMYTVCYNHLDVHFSLCAPCPLREGCHKVSHARIPHLIDPREAKPVFCGEDRMDTMKTIRQWKSKDPEHLSAEPPSKSQSSKASKPPVYVMDLPWSVFNMVCQKLKTASTLGRDWRGLAGLMGYSAQQVEIYEASKSDDPVSKLICDWSRTNRATVSQLTALLQELERVDIVTDIQEALSAATISPPSLSPRADNPKLHATTPSNVTLCEMGIELPSSPEIQSDMRKGQVTVADQAMGSVSMDEGKGPKPTVGVKLNNLDNNNQVDMVSGIGTEMMITPVETPRRSGMT